MKYLLAMYGDEKAQHDLLADQGKEVMAGWFKLDEDIRSAVEVIDASALQPTATTTTVRFIDGSVVTSDGPFAETKEQLGGYYIVDVDNLDTALEWAGKMTQLPGGGAVEVRPLAIFEQ